MGPGACDDKPDRVSVLNVATKANGDLDTILGSAYVPDPEHPGELLVQFPGNPRVPTGSWRLTTSTTLLSTLARISCLEQSSLSLLGSWQESNTLILKCLSMQPMCLWRMGSISHPWRTLSRMRTVCMTETFEWIQKSFLIRSVL